MTKEYKAYKKMHKQHKKELKKLVKVDAEWDWSFLHDLVMTKIRHMYEYYKAGNNVWQSDETLLPTIDELKYVLDLQYELEHLHDDIPAAEMIKNEDGSLTFSRDAETYDRMTAAYKRETEIYEEMYAFIGKNLQKWWD